MVGLNFYAKSPRCIAVERAADILRTLPETVDAVGVFADATAERIRNHVRSLERIRTIQVHGAWPRPGEMHPKNLFIAAHVADVGDIAELKLFLAECAAAGSTPAAVLVDARVAGGFGGTGKTAPWHLLEDFRPGVPLILAGGLTPENVADAIRAVRPYAVDVASGVESTPGRKDSERMRRFIDNARTAAAGLTD
jgi:phosphoribosylanthranilate isomerase